MADAQLRRAVESDIEIISEASRYIPKKLKARHPSVTHDLTPLKAAIESMLLEVDAGPDTE